MPSCEDIAASARDPMIRVRNLSTWYGERQILHDISFDVEAGRILVILGGSGSGKSTLLRHMIGLEPVRRGTVELDGTEISGLEEHEMVGIRREIGMCFQGAALFNSMTVGENVALPLREHTRLEDSTIRIMSRMKLDLVGLAGFEDYLPAELSGGMRKRAAIARALAMDPKLLFFDEPSAGLDPIVAAGLDRLILELSEAFHMTMAVVTHEMESAFLIADRILMIDRGHVVALGSPEEVRASEHPRVRQFLERRPDDNVREEAAYLAHLTGDRRSG